MLDDNFEVITNYTYKTKSDLLVSAVSQ